MPRSFTKRRWRLTSFASKFQQRCRWLLNLVERVGVVVALRLRPLRDPVKGCRFGDDRFEQGWFDPVNTGEAGDLGGRKNDRRIAGEDETVYSCRCPRRQRDDVVALGRRRDDTE